MKITTIKRFLFTFSIIFLTLIISCKNINILKQKEITQIQTQKKNTEDNLLNQNTKTQNKNLLKANDSLRISIYDNGEQIHYDNYTINEEGDIYITSVGKINLKDINIEQAYDIIESQYRTQNKNFKQKCKIYIPWLKGKSVIYIRGAVKKTGFINYNPKMDCSTAINLAGGLETNGDIDNIDISSKGIDKSEQNGNTLIHAGDILFVNKKNIFD